MFLFSSSDLAIRRAAELGTLRVTKQIGRFGAYWAIEDDHGLIEVALSKDEANERVAPPAAPISKTPN